MERKYLVALHEFFSGYLEVVCGIPPKHKIIAARGLKTIRVSDTPTICGATSEISIFIKYRGENRLWKIGINDEGEILGDVGTLTSKNYAFLCGLYIDVLSMACEVFGAIKTVEYFNRDKTIEIVYENGEKHVINVSGLI